MGRTDKNKHVEPIMTNSAALRVLYDLAGGRMKTWGALGRELGAMLGDGVASGQAGAPSCGSLPPVNVDDIYKRNRPWPSGFGPKEYCRAFRKYADEGHASHYGALLKVQQSLEASNAYTPQVKALMENIRPDADDREVAEGLERVMEAIVETARPYNKVGSPAGPVPRGDERCGEADETCSAERHEPGASANAVLSAQTCPSATGKSCDSRAAMAITSSGEISLSHIVRLLESCAFGKTGVEILMRVVPARLFGATALNTDLTQACEQGLSLQAQAALAQELCCDSGLACRAMRRSCETLVTSAAMDADKVFSCATLLFAAPSGYPAGAELSRALSLYTRYADGDAARTLFCLVLMGLVGIPGFNRIMMCPEVGLLFAH